MKFLLKACVKCLSLAREARRQHKAQGGAGGATLGLVTARVKEPVKRAADHAAAHFVGFKTFNHHPPGVYAPGFILTPASRAENETFKTRS